MFERRFATSIEINASAGDGKTGLTQGERFSGLLVGLLSGTLSATEAGFKAMNSALKQEADRCLTVR